MDASMYMYNINTGLALGNVLKFTTVSFNLFIKQLSLNMYQILSYSIFTTNNSKSSSFMHLSFNLMNMYCYTTILF